MNAYTIGTLITLTGAFTAVANGAPTDPTAVACRVKLPDGSIVDLSSSVTKLSTGNYAAPYLPPAIGQYSYEFIGTGAVQAASVSYLYVSPATF